MSPTKLLSDKDRSAATKALIRWFKSQDINPKDAGLMMLEISAMLLVDKTTNPVELMDAAKTWQVALVMEMTLQLQSKGI